MPANHRDFHLPDAWEVTIQHLDETIDLATEPTIRGDQAHCHQT